MSAPSFSSFPPSFSSFPDLGSDPIKPADARSSSKRTEDKKGKKDKGSKEKKRKREQHKDAGDIDSLGQGKNQFLEDERLKAQEDNSLRGEGGTSSLPLFYSDRKGDSLNVSYGGLHAGDVPKHHLVGRGAKILGLGNNWTAIHRSGKGVEVVDSRQRMPQLTDPKSRALLASAPTRRLLSPPGSYKYEEIDGFLRLPSRRGRNDDQAYRSITRHATNSDSETSVSDAEHSSTDDNSDTMPLTSYQETSKSLDLQLNADPSSVSTWLRLLSHSLSTIPLTSKNAIKTRSEITISIMSRALSAHPQNSSSKLLRLKYLKAGEEVWHESKLRAEWEEAWKVGGIEIWMEWLEWRMRGRSKGVDGFIEDGVRVLQALGTEDELSKVRVFWRLVTAFHNAGFVERATALLQAQSELTFEVPQAFRDLSIDYQLDNLEEFWESEALRVGEPEAKGWATWMASGRPTHVLAASSKVMVKTAEEPIASDPYTQWSIQETSADRALRMPIRALDETNEFDPYATILFSDIRPLLFPLQSTRAKDAIRFVWLSFLGLHIPGFVESLSADRHANADDRWCYTYLTNPSYLAGIFPSDATQRRLRTDAYAGVIIGREREYSSGFGPIKNWGYGVIGPLESVDGKGCLWTTKDVQGVDESFVRRIFAQLRLGAEDYEWDTLCLAFEAAISAKSALKVSRSFLSTARDSLPHWAAHAHLERSRGRTDDARKVYQTVLVASARPATINGMSRLWWDWAEMEWLVGRSDAALQVVVRSAGVDGTAGVMILRARRNLEEAVVAAVQWKDREAWIKILALLENLTSSMDAALSVFDRHLVNLESGTVGHESLTVACLVMIYRQGVVLRNLMPPSILRARVEKAVGVYPSNTVLLGMFLEGEKGQGVWGRVRGLLGEGTRGGAVRDKDIARRVMEVWIAGWERGRWEGEKERIRSGFEDAIRSERTRNSAIIWRIYIEFEIRVGQMQLAKKMLFRAIGECPLVKELYLLAFGPLRSVFSAGELNSFADTMAERELRMRKSVDEMLNGWEGHTGEDGGSEDSEDEIEHNARELVRLRPY